jgi:hypothetical protein
MRYLVSASLILAGIIHLLPLSGAIGGGRLAASRIFSGFLFASEVLTVMAVPGTQRPVRVEQR